MTKDKEEAIISAVVLLVFFGALLTIALFVSRYRCSVRWEGSGMATSFGTVQGCRIQTLDGRWIPEDRYREVDR